MHEEQYSYPEDLRHTYTSRTPCPRTPLPPHAYTSRTPIPPAHFSPARSPESQAPPTPPLPTPPWALERLGGVSSPKGGPPRHTTH